MALALVAVLAAAAAPLLSDTFSRSQSDEASSVIEQAALNVREEAVRSGTRQTLELSSSGVVPGGLLPSGWKLEVRRFEESRFRAPRDGERWEFNNAGICEPLGMRISGGGQSVEIRFDPLTAESVDD